MKPTLIAFITIICPLFLSAQNVGIGTTTPTGPLSFANVTGNKLVLWGDGNSSHYGIGVQGGILQLYANQPADIIAFGTGSSTSFTERARIYRNSDGLDGMTLRGRLHLQNGNTSNAGGGGGIWLYKPDNTSIIGFMGTQNDRNIGFYGGPTQWGFTYDVTNGRVGIGNNLPNAPLAFAPALGKKITLYPGATGDAGLGMSGNRLQIYADNPNADVALGYDAAGVFNERFAFKPNGALAVQGNLGSPGYSLLSNGNSGVSWAPPIATAAVVPSNPDNGLTYATNTNLGVELANIQMTVTVPAGQNARLFISGNIIYSANGCTGFGCVSGGDFYFTVNDVRGRRVHFMADNGFVSQSQHAMYPWDVGPGTYTIKWFVEKTYSNVNNISVTPLYATCLVIPR